MKPYCWRRRYCPSGEIWTPVYWEPNPGANERLRQHLLAGNEDWLSYADSYVETGQPEYWLRPDEE